MPNRDNLMRLAAGRRTGRRRNAGDVDLNRNFPPQTTRLLWSPTAGSRFRRSPFHRGPHPLSEPEAQAVVAVARASSPAVAVAFHSFGNLLLYPYAYTRASHPRRADYVALGAAMRAAQRRPYRVMQACQLYPINGELDDWLDGELGTLAVTFEVSELDRRVLSPARATNPFWWANPTDVDGTIANLTPGVLALVRAALELTSR